jgi:hypothetical protein
MTSLHSVVIAEPVRTATLFHQQRTFAEAAKWAFPFKKFEDFKYEPGPPVRRRSHLEI